MCHKNKEYGKKQGCVKGLRFGVWDFAFYSGNYSIFLKGSN
jgi:hypothetical protein